MNLKAFEGDLEADLGNSRRSAGDFEDGVAILSFPCPLETVLDPSWCRLDPSWAS